MDSLRFYVWGHVAGRVIHERVGGQMSEWTGDRAGLGKLDNGKFANGKLAIGKLANSKTRQNILIQGSGQDFRFTWTPKVLISQNNILENIHIYLFIEMIELCKPAW